MMKYLFVLIMAFAIVGWSIPKPMESIENYNVMLIHGAYGFKKGFSADTSLPEAYNAGGALENGATLGEYANDVQGNFYNGDVDKIITLDSPHEGTGALNMQLNMQWSNYLDNNALEGLTTSGFAISSRHPEQSEGSSEVKV